MVIMVDYHRVNGLLLYSTFSLLLFAHFTRLKIKPIRKWLVVKKLIYFFLPDLNQAHILNALIKTFSLNRRLYKFKNYHRESLAYFIVAFLYLIWSEDNLYCLNFTLGSMVPIYSTIISEIIRNFAGSTINCLIARMCKYFV